MVANRRGSMKNYFVVKLTRPERDGSSTLMAQYMVETSQQALGRDLKENISSLRRFLHYHPMRLSAEELIKKNPLRAERLFAGAIASSDYVLRFQVSLPIQEPEAIRIRPPTDLGQPLASHFSSVTGARLWLVKEGNVLSEKGQVFNEPRRPTVGR
jgi:hypothetical protein